MTFVRVLGSSRAFRGALLFLAALLAAPAFAAPTISLAFQPTSSITVNGVARLNIFIVNPDATTMTGGQLFTPITYPAGLVNATTPVFTNTCSATISAAAGGNTLGFSNVTLPAFGSCTIEIQVTSATEGSYAVTNPGNNFGASTGGYFPAVTTSPPLTVTMNSIAVTTTGDSGAGTLRQAITDANLLCASLGPFKITFSIPGAGPHVITLATSLPDITCHGTIIDGYTQPGSAANTMSSGGNNADIRIQVDGNNNRAFYTSFANNVVFRGLSITRGNEAIYFNTCANCSLEGCYINVAPDGTTTTGLGIYVNTSSGTIGGTEPGKHNLWAGSSGAQVYLNTSPVTMKNNAFNMGRDGAALATNRMNTPIYLNATGVTITLNTFLSADGDGIYVGNGTNTISDNVFKSNRRAIYISSGNFHTVSGNTILDPTMEGIYAGTSNNTIHGNTVRGGAASGILVPGGFYTVSNNTVENSAGWGIEVSGSNVTLQQNVVRNNTLGGIRVSGQRVRMSQNLSHSNGGPGIDLGGDGPTPNDESAFPYDADLGANELQNYPVITSVAHIDGNTVVTGTLKTNAGGFGETAVVEVFQGATAPATTEGAAFVGDTGFLSIDANGLPSPGPTWSVVLPGLLSGYFSATATHDTCGDGCTQTSEYSPAFAFTALTPNVTTTFVAAATPYAGNVAKINIAVSNPNVSTTLTSFSFTFTNPAGWSSNMRIVAAASLADCSAPGSFSNTTSSATFMGPAIAAGGTCTFEISFVPETFGIYTFDAGALSVSSTFGAATNGNSTSLNVSLVSPGFGFGSAPTVTVGVPVTVNFFGSRLAAHPTYSNIGFTLTLPANVTVAPVPNATTDCSGGGSVTASPGGSTITVAGMSILGSSCSLFSVDLVFATAGSHTLSIPGNTITWRPGASTAGFLFSAPLSHTVSAAGAPAATFSPASLTFAAQNVGTTSSPQTITLTNTGGSTLNIASFFTVGSDFLADFAASTCDDTPSLAPSPATGSSCIVVMTFQPTASGPRSASLRFNTNAPGSPHFVPLNGTGTLPGQPAVGLSSTSLAFGDQTINTASAPQTVMVTNAGTADLTITSVVVNGDFSFSGCATPITLVPGGSCNLAVTFFPTATGLRSGSITVASDAPGSPHVITLSGTGTPVPMPGIALAPASASFSATVGGTASHVFALSNTGNASLAISSIAVGPPSPPPLAPKAVSFSRTHDCPQALAPGAACSITVTYAPTAPGTESAELQVFSNAVPSPKTALLSGTATASAAVSLSSASVAFPPQIVGTRSAAQTVTLTNTGTGALTITAISATGDFGYGGCGFPSTLAPGAACAFDITFRPLTEGPQTGSITIASNAAGSPHAIALSGTGAGLLGPAVGLSPAALGFGTVRLGRSVTLPMRLINNGAAPLSIASIAVTGAHYSQTHNCPGSLAVAAGCDIHVTYEPTASGAHAGQLIIHSNAVPSPHVAALSGTGQAVPPPFLQVDAAVSFGSQVLGTTARRTLTLANTGGEALRVTALRIVGTGASAFGVEGDCETIAPERTCDLAVTFTATALAPFEARLDIVSNHSAGVVQVQLAGTGVPTPRPELAVSPGGLGFGSQAVGTTGETRTVVVTSVGQIAARISGFDVSPDYSVNANECPATLVPQASCNVHVTFRPIASGPRVGRLNIASDAVGSPNSVSLTGVGCRFFSMGGGRSTARLCAP